MSSCVSLRAAISVVCAVLVAVIAAVTLSITLTTSLSALRHIGQSHAQSLLANANSKSEALFEEQFILADTIRNYTMSKPWPWPSDDLDTFQKFEELHLAMFMQTKLASPGFLTYFRDNTRIGIQAIPELGIYGGSRFRPAPFSNGGIAYQATQPITRTLPSWNATDNTPVKPPSAGSTPALVTTTALWSTMQAATLGGTTATATGVYLVESVGVPADYILIAVPLYQAGVKFGTLPQIYGITLCTMFTSDLGRFLKGVGGTPNTFAAAVDINGFLVAVQTGAPAFEKITMTTTATATLPKGCASTTATAFYNLTNPTVWMSCRTKAADYPFAPLQAVAGNADMMLAKAPTVNMMTIDSEEWYAATARVPMRFPGLGLQLVLLLPENDIIGDVVQGRNIAVGVTCGVVVVAAAVGFALISILLSPLPVLAQRMMKASTLSDSSAEREYSGLAEVRELQEAYYELNDELNRIKSFVPQSVLAAMEDPALDGDLDLDTPVERSSQSGRGEHASTLGARSRRSSKRSSSHNSGGDGAAGLAALGLNVQAVSVACFNLDGFQSSVHDVSRTAVVDGVADFITTVTTQMRANGGVLHAFHGDHVVATYNAIKPCAAHARSAISTALRVQSLAHACGLKLRVRVGVATGRCVVGNLGSSDAKAFHVIGAPFMHAALLERLSLMYVKGGSGAVLATRRSCDDVATQFLFKYVDIVMLPHASKPTLIGAVVGEVTNKSSASQRHEAGSEWLYLVGDAAANNPFAKHNEAFERIAEGVLIDGVPRLVHDEEGANTVESAPSIVDGMQARLTEMHAENQSDTTDAAGFSGNGVSRARTIPRRDLGAFYTETYLWRLPHHQ